MPESAGDLITIALGLTVVWFLFGWLASREHRWRHGSAPDSERPSRRGGAHRPSHR